MYGSSDDYVASVRCLTGEGVLFVSVAGPDGRRSQAYAEAVRQAFLGTGPSAAR